MEKCTNKSDILAKYGFLELKFDIEYKISALVLWNKISFNALQRRILVWNHPQEYFPGYLQSPVPAQLTLQLPYFMWYCSSALSFRQWENPNLNLPFINFPHFKTKIWHWKWVFPKNTLSLKMMQFKNGVYTQKHEGYIFWLEFNFKRSLCYFLAD